VSDMARALIAPRWFRFRLTLSQSTARYALSEYSSGVRNSGQSDFSACVESSEKGVPVSAFCHRCGVQLLPDAQFCQKCGAAISVPEPNPGPPVSATDPRLVTPQTVVPKSKRAIVLKLVVGIIVGLTVIFFMILAGSTGHDRQQPATGEQQGSPPSASNSQSPATSGQATSDGINPLQQVCQPLGVGVPADPSWQSCSDQNYAALMQQLKHASFDPISAPHKEIVDLTIKGADEIYRTARGQYLKGYEEKNEYLSDSAYLQETFVGVAVVNAVTLFNKSNPDFTNNLGEYAVDRVGDARKHYESAAASLAAYSLRPDLSVHCDTSIESLRQELDQGIKQISLTEHLDAKSDPEEYYLRVNYGDMLISNASDKLVCYKSAAANIQDQPQRQEAANQQAQVQNSNPTAQQPEVPQEPKPVSAENPTPPTQPPSIAEIDQQAAALWNQKRYSEAMPLFNQACSSGNADSCTRLGLMYDFGQGIVQDFSRAEAYYLKACNTGNEAACGNLSILTDYAPGSPQCNSTTLALMVNRYRDSCNAGNGLSCDTLGHLYSYGCGIGKDAAEARQLYSKACTIGKQQGCDRLKEMQ